MLKCCRHTWAGAASRNYCRYRGRTQVEVLRRPRVLIPGRMISTAPIEGSSAVSVAEAGSRAGHGYRKDMSSPRVAGGTGLPCPARYGTDAVAQNPPSYSTHWVEGGFGNCSLSPNRPRSTPGTPPAGARKGSEASISGIADGNAVPGACNRSADGEGEWPVDISIEAPRTPAQNAVERISPAPTKQPQLQRRD